jgi:hypothetical protein
MVDWLALQLHIREVSVSSICPQTGCSHWDFSLFTSVAPVIYHDYLKLGHGRFLPHPFNLLIVHCPIIWLYMFWATDVFLLWLYSPAWTLVSLMIIPQRFLTSAFFHHGYTLNVFTSFKTLWNHLNLSLLFYREPSGWEKVVFVQGEFSSILTKCSSHLMLDLYTNSVVHHWINSPVSAIDSFVK